MNSVKKQSKLQGLLAEVEATGLKLHGRGSLKGFKIGQELYDLASLDYVGPLRRTLNRTQLDELVRDASRTVWPHLNREPLRLGSIGEFSKRFSLLGIEVCPTKMSSDTGSALLGFYVRKTEILSGRPLICVNTAHHPAAVGATFVHEMGHHLTSEIFGSRDESPNFLLYSGYAEHLNEPSELVADIFVSLGIYPRAMARTMFPRPKRIKTSEISTVGTTSPVLGYLAKQYGLSFDGKLPDSQKFQYLAGLLHYTKLREALRDEFDL